MEFKITLDWEEVFSNEITKEDLVDSERLRKWFNWTTAKRLVKIKPWMYYDPNMFKYVWKIIQDKVILHFNKD